jgi:hypothetical protein
VPYSKRQIRRILQQKFEFIDVEGSKHEALAFHYEGIKIATIRFSIGANRDIDNNILNAMSREVRVNKLKFFKDMIDCPKNQNDYISRLKELNFIDSGN